ncbi:zonular occludens toxin domain-containing protein [Escherichia coli]|uniref:zonular occludens toxin domain-containing protein n=14 Tax=Gammaproteobacteria TaxID=1236 RepID=UPI0009458647
MAISAYIGIPGSGKSYEAVCNVIIPAFTSGRRVVTNIYGLQKDKITERYPDATGEIIVVDNDDVLKADFFPFKGGEGSFCQFGDLIVIDEAWRIFGSDKDMTAEKKSFIAEHRHFTHPETGISCDLVIVNQSLSNIARFLKDKIETTYRMRKLKALGLNNHYCIDVYSGHKIYKSNLPEAISLIYSEVLKVPYMLDPQLVNDERMITFRLTPDIDEREFVTRYLGNMNIRIWTKKGVDFIAPYTPKEPVKPRYTWTYTPQYRSVAYLSDILGGYVSGSFNNSGAVISDDSLKGSSGASNYINRTGDILVYYGTKEDIAILKTLVTSLDTMSDEVVVSGYVFEVQTSQSDGSGILLAAKILSDKFNISVGAAGLDNFINIRTGSIDAIFNLLKTDSRFTVVSAPRLRVKNNASASFSVGSDVPVLGSVTVNNNTTTQSVEYRSSGVLFNVTPSIKSRTMDLKIQQQLSNFVTTETGVNNSPTLIKRDVTTEVSLADGDIILLGGLAEQKDSKASSGWSFFGSRTSESNKTDIMVMLQVRKVDRSRATPRSAARSGELFRDNLN